MDDLLYSTYLGGSGNDYGNGIAVDAQGNAYVTGETWSASFPTTAGAFQTGHGGFDAPDAFVTKLRPGDRDLVYSTFLGGSGGDAGFAIVVDAQFQAHITGWTFSHDFPGATEHLFHQAIFVMALNATGTAPDVYSIILGRGTGPANDASGRGIAVDARDNVYVTGETAGPDFVTTLGAFQTTRGGLVDAFVAKIFPNNPVPTATALSPV